MARSGGVPVLQQSRRVLEPVATFVVVAGQACCFGVEGPPLRYLPRGGVWVELTE